MDEHLIKDLNLRLLEEVEVVYLATVDEKGFPQVRAMANLRNVVQFHSIAGIFEGHKDDFLMYFTSHKSSDKIKHIGANSAISVYFCDARKRCGMLLFGKIDIVSDAKLKKEVWQERWIKHFPGGDGDPEYTVLRFVPSFAKGWSPQGPFQLKLAEN